MALSGWLRKRQTHAETSAIHTSAPSQSRRASGSPDSVGRNAATNPATTAMTAGKPRGRAVSSPSSTSAIAVSDAEPERERVFGAKLCDGAGVDTGGDDGGTDRSERRGAPERRRRDTDVSPRTSISVSG